jgi:hypothetical protein
MDLQNAFDVIVIGGGPSGFAAAVAAARTGQRAALVDRYPTMGGMGTAALVNNFCGAQYDGKRYIIGGIFGELRQRLIRRKAIYWLGAFEPYNPEVYSEEMIAMSKRAGVHLFLGSSIENVELPSSTQVRVKLSDNRLLTGKTIVDATGDAIIANRVGAKSNFGRPSDNAVMPLTMCYIIGPVNVGKIQSEWPEALHIDGNTGEKVVFFGGHNKQVDAWLKQARNAGEISIQRDHVAAVMAVPLTENQISVNFGRVNVKDPSDPAQLAAAEVEGRKQVDEGIRFFRKYLPGLENVELKQMARQIGVRQSRQIQGLYTINREDVLECRQFPDVIAQSHYPIDIHEPYSDKTTLIFLKEGEHYDIPLRCLIPAEGPENIIISGRAISATHEAMSSLRVSACAMAIGEAAGTTAAIAARDSVPMRDVPVVLVQDELLEHGAILV